MMAWSSHSTPPAAISETRTAKMIAGGTQAGKDLYCVNGNLLIVECINITHAIPNLETWHHCLGHVSYQSVIYMAKKGLTQGMPTNLSTLPAICEHYIVGKQTKTPVLKVREGMRAKFKLEKVYSGITGPEVVMTNTGKRYMLNLIDDFTSFSWNYTRNLMPKLYSKSGKHTLKLKLKISIFCTDSSGEYTSADFQDITM